ncbi:hypothetical protein AB0K02_20730 [Streptomyces sp. NPDC049597]|uniref:hypothetical protein n=1 Tax=Streptomyces sp. NPDC049597 TaxID=3155276 RepID=UPI00342AB3BB
MRIMVQGNFGARNQFPNRIRNNFSADSAHPFESLYVGHTSDFPNQQGPTGFRPGIASLLVLRKAHARMKEMRLRGTKAVPRTVPLLKGSK